MDLALFPALKVELGASCALEVEGRFYMFQAEGSVFCLGVYSDPSTVIGNNFLQGQSVVFDLEKRRWGVGAANISDWEKWGPLRTAAQTKPSSSRITRTLRYLCYSGRKGA